MKSRKKPEITIDLLFQARRDIIKLTNILRGEKYKETCTASGHVLLFCTQCNPNATDAVSRIKQYRIESS